MTELSKELLTEAKAKTKNISPMVGDAIDWYWQSTVWPLFRDMPGFLLLYDEGYTFQKVKMGHWQVWAYSDHEIRGIVVTRVQEFPKCKVLDIVGMAGICGIDFMENLSDVFEILAEQQGCTYLTSGARPGMERILARKFRAQRMYSVMIRPVGLLKRKS